jgi:hypothetical protein
MVDSIVVLERNIITGNNNNFYVDRSYISCESGDFYRGPDCFTDKMV